MEMNPLIESLTGIKNFLDFFELSRVALTPDDDPALAANYDGKVLYVPLFYDTEAVTMARLSRHFVRQGRAEPP